MTGIQASNLNLRSVNGEMVPMSQWTFGDFSANLIAGQFPLVDGYILSIKTKDDEEDPTDLSKRTLILEATGVESKNTYVFATGDINGSGNGTGILEDTDTTYTLSWDANAEQLVFQSSTGETTRISLTQQEKSLDNATFLNVLFS